MHARTLTLAAVLLFLTAACSDSSDRTKVDPAVRLAEITDFESYDWQEIPAGPRWEPRAGLQALELNDKFYLFGGRTPRPPTMPNPNHPPTIPYMCSMYSCCSCTVYKVVCTLAPYFEQRVMH